MFDVSAFGAFLGGLLSFLSPCVLPIVPFYLCYLAGVSMNQISADAALEPRVARRALFASIFFALGIITIFVGLGASATMLGQVVSEYFHILRYVAAAVIIILGLHFLEVISIGVLDRQFGFGDSAEVKEISLWGSYVLGLAFAFGWTPCVGPVLAAILFMAAGEQTAWQGAWLLLMYGAGMTLPFILAAAFIGPFMRWLSGFRKYLGLMKKIMGGFLILFGVLIATNAVNLIAQWMLETFPVFGTIG